jgi:hypothetical protein
MVLTKGCSAHKIEWNSRDARDTGDGELGNRQAAGPLLLLHPGYSRPEFCALRAVERRAAPFKKAPPLERQPLQAPLR